MALDEEAGRFPAELPGGGRRHGAAVERVEIAPGGEHVEASARGGTRRPGLDKTALEPGKQAGELGRTACRKRRTQAVLDLLQDSTGARPARLGCGSAGNERTRQPLEALDRVAVAAPRLGPVEGSRTRASPRLAERAVERIETPADGEIGGKRAQ